nr:sugar ABC transporter substrate-binding protein [uncultured Agathobaculum sp.]
MSNLKKIGALFLSSALLASTLVGCGGSTESEESGATEEASGAHTISIVFKTTSNEYTQYMMAGAEAASEEYGVTLDMKGATSETAYDEQQNMIETDLNSGKYDAMIIAPLQGDMVSTLVSGTNMPIFAIDTDFDAAEKISFIGIGQADAAASGGEAAVEAAKAAGWTDIKAAYIAGVQGDSTAEARKTGFQEGIEAAGGTFLVDEIQYADAVADKAANCMEAIMQNHPEGLAIICCHNDDCAIAAARAAENNPAYANTIFVGFDGNITAAESILDGGETITVAQSGYDQGYRAVETVAKYLDGEEVESFVDCGTQVIDKDSAEDYLKELEEQMGGTLEF